MPIIRGYSFSPSEFVTADKLHQLVDSASVTDLSTDEFSGEVRGLVTATPSSIVDGTVYFLHETSVSLVRPTGLSLWSNPNYLVHYNGQWISLLGADHLETGRFFNEIGGTIAQGEHAQFGTQAGSGHVTLTLAVNSSAQGKAMTLGANQGPDSTDGTRIRIRMIGPGLFKGSSKTANSTWLDSLYHASADSLWTRSTASDHSGTNAMRLNTTADGDSDTGRLQPAYHLGSLVFVE
jgi:hypothetical protein